MSYTEGGQDEFHQWQEGGDDIPQPSVTAPPGMGSEGEPELGASRLGMIILIIVHIATLVCYVVTTIFGFTRFFNIRNGVEAFAYNGVGWWTLSLALFISPWIFGFMTLVYVERLRDYTGWYNLTYSGRAVIIFLYGVGILTTRAYDIVFAIFLMIAGILFFILEILSCILTRFIPRPDDGLIPLKKCLNRSASPDDEPGDMDGLPADI